MTPAAAAHKFSRPTVTPTAKDPWATVSAWEVRGHPLAIVEPSAQVNVWAHDPDRATRHAAVSIPPPRKP